MGRGAKVLLIGTSSHWIPTDSFELLGMDLWPANFGYSSRSRTMHLPDPLEFDLIVGDFHNSYENSEFERQLVEGDAYRAHPLLSTAWFDEAFRTAASLRDQFRRAVSVGATMVVVCGPLGSHGKVSNYDWIPFPNEVKGQTRNPFSGPAQCIWEADQEAPAALVEEFAHDFSWDVGLSIDEPEEPKRRLPLLGPQWRAPSKPDTGQPAEIWARNKAGEVVAVRFEIGKGDLILVPNIRDSKRRSELVQHLVTTFYPSRHPDLVPGYWASAYWPPSLAEREAGLRREEDAFRKQLEPKRAEVAALKEQLRPFRPLIYTKANTLKSLVAQAFSEVFGFRVTDMDSRTAPGEPKVFDLLVESGKFRFAVEVRGKENRSLQGNDIDKLVKNLRKFGDSGGLSPVFVLNPAFEYPVGDIHRFLSPEQISYAASNGICVMTTSTLLEAITQVWTGGLQPERLRGLLSRAGELCEEDLPNSQGT